jgi:hypothetical protein
METPFWKSIWKCHAPSLSNITPEPAFAAVLADIESTNSKGIDNFTIFMNFPRRLYLFMGDRGWKGLARRNGLSKKDLYKRPYQ